MRKFNAVKIAKQDNVVTAVMDISQGEEVTFESTEQEYISALEFVQNGFKIALCDIPKDGIIIKYGEAVGIALAPIPKGALVHIHNIRSNRGKELRK